MSMSPEELLLRWVNYHLQNAGTGPIKNFSEDIKDSRAYFHLLNQIALHEQNLYKKSVYVDISGLNVRLDFFFLQTTEQTYTQSHWIPTQPPSSLRTCRSTI